MVKFISDNGSAIIFKCMNEENEHRFTVVENLSFSGGWNLYTPDSKIHIGRFDTLCGVEQYIDEMDK